MVESKELYFDTVEKNGLNAFTTDLGKIYYNLNAINEVFFDSVTDCLIENNSASSFYTAGRFLIIVSLTFDKNGQEMVALDLKNDDRVAVETAKAKIEVKDRFMRAYNDVKRRYYQDYFKFSLVEGSVP